MTRGSNDKEHMAIRESKNPFGKERHVEKLQINNSEFPMIGNLIPTNQRHFPTRFKPTPKKP